MIVNILRKFGKKNDRGVKFNEKVAEFKEKKRLKSTQAYSAEKLGISTPHPWLTNQKRIKAFAHILQTNRNKNRITNEKISDKDKEKYAKFKMEYQYYKYKEFMLQNHIERNKIDSLNEVKKEVESMPYRLKTDFNNLIEKEFEELPEELDPVYLYYGQMKNIFPSEISTKYILERRLDLIFKDKLID